MKKSITLSSVAVASLLLVGCGNGESTTNSSAPMVGTGYYVDSAIKGVDYSCGTQSGTTDIEGKFSFEKNQNCTFKVGNVLLREVNASTLKDGITILEDNPNTARFLQTLDKDGNASNGIEVSDGAKKLELTEVPTEDSVLVNVKDDIKANDEEYQGRVVTTQESEAHLNETRSEIKNDNRETQYSSNSSTNLSTEQTKAYFGDKVNNLIVVVDVEKMKVLEKIPTGNSVSYAAEVIKTKASHGSSTPKMYIDNRGSNAIGVLDSATNTITKNIALAFHPRSIDVEKQTGLVAVSGVDKAMVAIIDSKTDSVIATVGNNVVTSPTTSGHSYVASGTMASGHPHWLNENHFVLIDRQNKSIATYKIEKNSNGMWTTTKVNEVATPSPVHNLVPPEIHGQHGRKHGEQTSTIFYATAEGATGIYPSVLKLEFLEGQGLSVVENLEIKKEGLSTDVMGVHHLNFLKDQKTIYVGSDEGNLFVVDYTTSPMSIVKTVKAGMGAGHTDEMKHNNIAVVINHKDSFITLMNTQTHEKIADIEVSNLAKDELGSVQTQSHPKYHFSKDGRYFYMFLTEEGAFVKVDLTTNKRVEYLEIGGKLAMGSFVEVKDKTKQGHQNSNRDRDNGMNEDTTDNQNEQNSNNDRDNGMNNETSNNQNHQNSNSSMNNDDDNTQSDQNSTNHRNNGRNR